MLQLLRSPRILVTLWNGVLRCSSPLQLHFMAA